MKPTLNNRLDLKGSFEFMVKMFKQEGFKIKRIDLNIVEVLHNSAYAKFRYVVVLRSNLVHIYVFSNDIKTKHYPVNHYTFNRRTYTPKTVFNKLLKGD